MRRAYGWMFPKFACFFLPTLVGCGSGMASGVVQSADFEKYRMSYLESRTCRGRDVSLLVAPPAHPYAVVASIEVRTSRPKSAQALTEELFALAMQIEADALLPPMHERSVISHAAFNPLKPFYIFDDGRTQVVEAQAIRYPRAYACRK